MQISVTCQFKQKNTLGLPPLLPASKSLTIGIRKNSCMLTKVENVAEMSSVAESYPGGGLKPPIFSIWMREFSLNSMWSCRLGGIAPFYAQLDLISGSMACKSLQNSCPKKSKNMLEILVSKPLYSLLIKQFIC